ncbi:MAG: nucleotidyl transferase AbiEii/AbiGii toxin family protein [Candidatus Aminicenantales bacterium]
MSLSLEFLERCASETGFRVSALEKVAGLGGLAGDITRHPLLGKVLALKGGTALNLCFGPPKRLSVDLDFNYVGHAEREKMLKERPLVEAALIELAQKRGFRVQKSAEAFAGRKFYLHYRSVLGPEDRVEVDLNFVFRVPLSGLESCELWQPGELDRPVVRMVGREELFIGKLLALLDRGAARDVWDTAHLPELAGGRMAADHFRKLFIALSVVLDHPLSTYSRSRLERLVTERVIVEQVAPLLNAEIELKVGELIDKAWAVVIKFFDLSAEEKDYLESAGRGDLRMELLFPGDVQEAMRVAAHPAIQWKISNVKVHAAKLKPGA